MKKISLNIIAVAALLVAVTFTGCTREESKNDNGPATLVLKIQQGVDSRAITDAVLSATPTFDEGWVFVTNGGGLIVHALEIVTNTAGAGQVSVTELKNGNGKAVFETPAGATTVYIFGNVAKADVTGWPETLVDASGPTYAPLTAAKAVGRPISDFTGVNLTVANLQAAEGVTKVPLYGSAAIQSTGTNTSKAEPDVYPVASRIEISKVSALKSNVSAFTVAEVFINNYYPSRNFLGGLGEALVNNGQTPANYATSTPGKYVGVSGTLYDAPATAAVTDGNTPERMEAKATTNKVWAYNLPVPVLEPTDEYFPHIVLKLTGVTTTGSTNYSNATKYLTVKTATAGSGGILKFTKGHIYTIADIKFTDTDLFDNPEPALSTLTVTATVKDWVILPITVSF